MIQISVERCTADGGEGRVLGPFAFIGVEGVMLINEYDEAVAALDSSGQWCTQDDGKAWGCLVLESVPIEA